jgi:hypothetical protein
MYYKIKREYQGVIPPGHNAGVIGNKPLVAIGFTGLKTLEKWKQLNNL